MAFINVTFNCDLRTVAVSIWLREVPPAFMGRVNQSPSAAIELLSTGKASQQVMPHFIPRRIAAISQLLGAVGPPYR